MQKLDDLLTPEHITEAVERSLQEDIRTGDVTGELLPPQLEAVAIILNREPMLLCGQAWVNAVFNAVDSTLTISWDQNEGTWINSSTTLCQIRGKARSILRAERTALNWLQTLSGTATATHHYVQAIKEYPTRLLDTRKTIPGLRWAQKYAVLCGGGTNHRMGLYDAFLIKENHIKACGSILSAIAKARSLNPTLFLEVEVESLDELQQALDAGPDRILLDNFTKKMLIEAVAMNTPKRCALEASGGVDLSSLVDIAKTGVDFISMGSLTKSVTAIDLSLLIKDIL